VVYDGKINVIKNALGTHTFISRVQGGKLKAKNEIRVASIFKNMPEDFLKMIIIHELAHFKEKEHNKAFYSFCIHMQPNYHQLEFDLRVYLTYIEAEGKLY
jgi:predicted metal-dependent hydrolase